MSETRRPKRADVTTPMLCRAIAEHGFSALDVLRRQFPAKVLLAAVERDAKGPNAYIDWGVSAWRPFLVDRGRRLLANADAADGDFERLRELLKDDPFGLMLLDFEGHPDLVVNGCRITREARVEAAALRQGFRAVLAQAWRDLQPPVLGSAFDKATITVEVRS